MTAPEKKAWYLTQKAVADYFRTALETYADGYGALPVLEGMAGEEYGEENFIVAIQGERDDMGNSLITLMIGVQTHINTGLERHALMQACLDDLLFDGAPSAPHSQFIAAVNSQENIGIEIEYIEEGSSLQMQTDGSFRQSFRTLVIYVRQT